MATVTDCPTRWPFLDKYDWKDAVPTRKQVVQKLMPKWKLCLGFVQSRRGQLLHSIPPEFDLKPDKGRTVHYHVPVLLDTGTTSYADTKISLDHGEKCCPAERILYIGDMQKHQRNWWYFVKPDLDQAVEAENPGTGHELNISFPGEFHGRYHTQHADDLLNKRFLYAPIFIHFDIKSLAKELLMKDQRRKETWTLVILSSVIEYLQEIYTQEELEKIEKLLNETRENLPVHHLIGWAFFHGNHIWASKFAVRVDDVDYLDFTWHYGLLLYGPTGKYQYKKGCMTAIKVLRDCEPNIRALLDEYRTVSDSGRPCTGEELDMVIEKASGTCDSNL